MAQEENKNEKPPCKVCGTPTSYVMNIDFKAVPICNGCATTIMLQQAKWLSDIVPEEAKKS